MELELRNHQPRLFRDWGELDRMKMWFWKLRSVLSSFYSIWLSMESSVVYVTPKRKFNRNTTCSPSDASPVEKRVKESNSPEVTSPGDEDEVMAALNLSEGVAEKFWPYPSKTMQFGLENGGFKHHSKRFTK